MSITSVLRVAGVLLALGLLGGVVSYALKYAHAAGVVVELERQREGLLESSRTANAAVLREREVGDSLGVVTDSLNLVIRTAVVVSVAAGNEARVVILERIPPEFRREVEALDDRRLADIARLQFAAGQDSVTISKLRVQILDERLGADRVFAADSLIIANLELQVSAFRSVAQRGWLDDLVGSSKWVAWGVAIGGGACYAFCPVGR